MIADVLDGIKTICEAAGWRTLDGSEALADGRVMIRTETVRPVYTENSTRHEAQVAVTLYRKIKPKQRYTSEKTGATEVESLAQSLKTGFTAWAVNLTVDEISMTETDGFRVSELTLTAVYNAV